MTNMERRDGLAAMTNVERQDRAAASGLPATRSQRQAKAALYLTAILWGASFTMTKNAVATMSPFNLLALRFTIAFCVPALFLIRRILGTDRRTFLFGSLAGVFMFIGGSFQTIGLQTTTPGKSSFLTATYCVMVPIVFWIIDRRRPGIQVMLAAIVCLAGVGFISLDTGFTASIGDLLTLASAVAYAAQIVVITKHVNGTDLVLFTLFQFSSCMVLAWAAVFLAEGGFQPVPSGTWPSLVYLGLASTLLAHGLQNYGQKRVPSAQASMILSLESVTGVGFSIIFFGERLTPLLVAGFTLIFLAVVLSESELPFLHRKRGPSR